MKNSISRRVKNAISLEHFIFIKNAVAGTMRDGHPSLSHPHFHHFGSHDSAYSSLLMHIFTVTGIKFSLYPIETNNLYKPINKKHHAESPCLSQHAAA